MNWYKTAIYEETRGNPFKPSPELAEKILNLYASPPEGKGYNVYTIIRELGIKVNPKSLRSFIRRSGMEIRTAPEQRVLDGRVFDINSLDEETVKKIDYLYALPPEGMGRNLKSIAKELGISYPSLKKFFRDTDRLRRSRGEQKRLDTAWHPDSETIEKIDKMYALPPEGEGRSLENISQTLNINRNRLHAWFKRTGREIRNYSEQYTPYVRQQMSDSSISEAEKALTEADKNYILKLYKEEGYSSVDISEHLDINIWLVSKILHSFGVVRKVEDALGMPFVKEKHREYWDNHDFWEMLIQRSDDEIATQLAAMTRSKYGPDQEADRLAHYSGMLNKALRMKREQESQQLGQLPVSSNSNWYNYLFAKRK